MNKRYKIVITEMCIDEVQISKSWERIEEVDGNTKWDYAPETTTKKLVERQIFSQDTDELDLVEVIKAVNGI